MTPTEYQNVILAMDFIEKEENESALECLNAAIAGYEEKLTRPGPKSHQIPKGFNSSLGNIR